MTILEFLNDFKKRFYKSKSYGTTLSDDILALFMVQLKNFSQITVESLQTRNSWTCVKL